MNETSERLAAAEQARVAMDRWVGPVLSSMKADYLKRLAEIAAQPMTDKARAGMEKLALGIKVINHVEDEIAIVIHDGAVARHEHDRANRLADLPAEQRKWLQW